MSLLLPDQGEKLILEAMCNKTAPQTLVLKLFKNNVTPGEADTEATYTEATFTGYASIVLTPASFTVATGNPSTLSYPQQTFTSTADAQNESIWGYYVIQQTSGKLMWAERKVDGAGNPFTVTNNGDAIQVTPKFTLE